MQGAFEESINETINDDKVEVLDRYLKGNFDNEAENKVLLEP